MYSIGKSKFNFLDLFAGAGGLSEGFVQAGFNPLAHIEMDSSACFTLKTRMAYHWLKSENRLYIYNSYLNREIDRDRLYNEIPQYILNSIMHETISNSSIKGIFNSIDSKIGGNKIDLIIGGPPCQAYSLVGRSRDKFKMKNDERNYLYKYYALFLEHYKPQYFVFENVIGLLSAKDNDGTLYFDKMRNLFEGKGYTTEYKILSANNYGVLQNRKRVILIGRLGKENNFYPEFKKWTPQVKVSEVFKDLPQINAGGGSVSPCYTKTYKQKSQWLYSAGIKDDALPVTWHQARQNNEQDLEIYRMTVEKWNCEHKRLRYNDLPERLKTHKNNQSFLDRFKVVAADLPYSQTVVAHISKDGHYYIHPDIKQNRSITPREAARLQSFPDSYYFESENGRPSRTDAYRQIGNAVPVLLAKKIADKMMEKMQNE